MCTAPTYPLNFTISTKHLRKPRSHQATPVQTRYLLSGNTSEEHEIREKKKPDFQLCYCTLQFVSSRECRIPRVILG